VDAVCISPSGHDSLLGKLLLLPVFFQEMFN